MRVRCESKGSQRFSFLSHDRSFDRSAFQSAFQPRSSHTQSSVSILKNVQSRIFPTERVSPGFSPKCRRRVGARVIPFQTALLYRFHQTNLMLIKRIASEKRSIFRSASTTIKKEIIARFVSKDRVDTGQRKRVYGVVELCGSRVVSRATGIANILSVGRIVLLVFAAVRNQD